MDDIYKEQILDHYKNPRNFGPAALPLRKGERMVTAKETNSSCGDEVEISFKFGKQREIKDVKFEGVGCAISVAGASLLIEKIKEKKLKVKDIEKLSREDMEEILGVEVGAVREKCMMLGLRAVKKAIKSI